MSFWKAACQHLKNHCWGELPSECLPACTLRVGQGWIGRKKHSVLAATSEASANPRLVQGLECFNRVGTPWFLWISQPFILPLLPISRERSLWPRTIPKVGLKCDALTANIPSILEGRGECHHIQDSHRENLVHFKIYNTSLKRNYFLLVIEVKDLIKPMNNDICF